MEDRIEADGAGPDHPHLRAAVQPRDPGRVAAQQLRREVPERADHARLDELDLAQQIVLAGLDLGRVRVAVAGGPAVVDDTSGRDEVVGALNIDAEERAVGAGLVGDVLDLDLVVHHRWLSAGESRRLERDRLRNIRMELVAHDRRHIGRDQLRQAARRRHVEVDAAAGGLCRQPEPQKPVEQDLEISVRERHARNLGQRLAAARTDARMAVVHEPEREHALVEPLAQPLRHDLLRTVEVASQDPQRPVRPRPNVNGAVRPVAAGDSLDGHRLARRTQLGQQLHLEVRVGRLALGVGHGQHRRLGPDRTVAEQRAAYDVEHELAEPLPGCDAVGLPELVDTDVAALGQDRVVARELDR